MYQKITDFTASKIESITSFSNRTGASIAKHISDGYQNMRGKTVPLVSPAMLYKIGLGAVWSDGVLEDEEIAQIEEWLNTQDPLITSCLMVMHPPRQFIDPSMIFEYTEPPSQLEGKILLFKFAKQIIERRQPILPESQDYLEYLIQWIGLEQDQIPGIVKQIDAESELERHASTSYNLQSLWNTTSKFAVDGGAYILDQSSRFKNIIGEKATNSWNAFEDVPKPLKVALVTAAAGGTVVASPFLIAALSSTSIITILATLGGGAIGAGGLGVAGGVGALIFSCATVSTLTAYIGSGLIKDPEVEKLIIALRDLHELVEKSKQISVQHIERLKNFDAAVKKLMLEKQIFSNEVILLRGKIESMQEEIQGLKVA
jgi:hypothetical protein